MNAQQPSPSNEPALPAFLRDAASLREHLQNHFESLNSPERGAAFLEFVLRLAPFIEELRDYEAPNPSPKVSHDRGVDFTAEDKQGEYLVCGQVKLKVQRVEEIDSIISKFRSFELQVHETDDGQGRLFTEGERPSPVFSIVTAADIDDLLARYGSSALASVAYYDKLKAEDRLLVIQGRDLLESLRGAYHKTFVIPSEFTLPLLNKPIEVDGVYLGMVDAAVLRDLYHAHGAAVFFENIREFLGVGQRAERETQVNDEILRTLTECPAEMLRRNNGITFKAEEVLAEGSNSLRLRRAGIVNGCQTTMCIVESEIARGKAQVVVKVVEAEDSWDIAKAANHQNQVARIDLDIARFLRPQLLKKFALVNEVGFDDPAGQDVATVLNAIHQHHASYEEMRCLFLGVFSRQPNNIFASNYNKLRMEDLQAIEAAGTVEETMRVLFDLQNASRSAIEATEQTYDSETYRPLFGRFFRETKPTYRAFLAILAAVGATGVDIYQADGNAGESNAVEFLKAVEALLIADTAYFERTFELAFEVSASQLLEGAKDGGDMEVLATMFRDLQSTNFQRLVQRLHLRMDNDSEVKAIRAKRADAL